MKTCWLMVAGMCARLAMGALCTVAAYARISLKNLKKVFFENGAWIVLNSGWVKIGALITGFGLEKKIRVARVTGNSEISEFQLFLKGAEPENSYYSEEAIPADGASFFIVVKSRDVMNLRVERLSTIGKLEEAV